jgi:phenylalanyl-tRNA synthetase beta chain
MIDALKIGQDDVRNRSVCIMNPLRQEESLMRTTLIPSLINNLIYNLNRGMRTIKFFEVSNVYFRKQGGGKLPVENLRLGGLSLVEKMHQLWNPGVDDFFTVKGDVEACIRTLTNDEGVWRRSDEPFLHPGKSADFVVKDRKAGFVGVLSPDVVSSLDFKVQKGDVVLFELDMDMLLSLSSKQKVFQKFSIYPYIQRDLSVLVDEGRSAGEVRAVLKSFKSELIDDIKIFDFYRGKNIPADKTSIAFTVTYRSFDRTLNEEEIDDVHQKLIAHLVEHTGAELRS